MGEEQDRLDKISALDAQIKTDEQKYSATQDERDADMKKQQEAYDAETSKHLADARKMPARPVIQEQKKRVNQFVPPIGSHDVMDWVRFVGNALALTGMVGAAISMKGSTMAATSLAAGMKGLKEGDEAAAKKNFDDYHQHVETVLKNYDLELKEHDDILYNDKLSVSEKFNAMNLSAKKWQNNLTLQAKSLKDNYTNRAAMQKAVDKLKEAKEKGQKLQRDAAIIQEFNKHNEDRKKAGLPPTTYAAFQKGRTDGNIKAAAQKEDEEGMSALQKTKLSEARKNMKDPKFLKENPDLANMSDEQIRALVLKKFPK